MQKIKISVCSLLATLALFTSCQKETATANYNVIPLPKSVQTQTEGEPFKLSNTTTIIYEEGNEVQAKTANLLAQSLKDAAGLDLKISVGSETENIISLKENFTHENNEAYQLEVSDKVVSIKGASEAGRFYGVQTLVKSLSVGTTENDFLLPQAKIVDYPRFSYRGGMLDVGRHFADLEFVKRYIDILALHNINVFHWHLTDDQGWRIEIKKYPKLTEIGSMRSETAIGKSLTEFDKTPHGGFYTQEEAREIVAYAKERFITVIPEFDLPGHMCAVLASYPEYGCVDEPYEVGKVWGVYREVLCVGNDKSLEFAQDVLSEIIDIFPSEYINIGGDECDKARWVDCPKCQGKIKKLGLRADKAHTAEQRLQSYFISAVEKYLNSKGRQIIGWDEILQGGLAPNATVMAWRSVDEGVKAAKMNHNVVMAPVNYCYFDYYQTKDIENPNTPFSIGGYLPLDTVYNFEPVSSLLTADECKYVIGAQANLWTEYINDDDHREYMLLPRLAAMSEVLWSDASQKDYADFLTRLPNMLNQYDKLGYTYSKVLYDVEATMVNNLEKKVVEVSLSTIDNAPVYYTLDGSVPTKESNLYSATLEIGETSTLKAVAIREKENSNVYTQAFHFSKSTLCPIVSSSTPNKRHSYDGVQTLVDARLGALKGYANGTWIGFLQEDPVEVTIDLGIKQSISTVGMGTFIYSDDWMFGSTGLTIEVSDDGKNFKQAGNNHFLEITENQKMGKKNISIKLKEVVEARYVRIFVRKTFRLPAWHQDAGEVPFLFIDEIHID